MDRNPKGLLGRLEDLRPEGDAAAGVARLPRREPTAAELCDELAGTFENEHLRWRRVLGHPPDLRLVNDGDDA